MKKLVCLFMIVVLMFALSVSAYAEETHIHTDSCELASNVDDGVTPCFSGVIAYCTNANCQGKPTVNLVCQGVYCSTTSSVCSTHDNCEIKTEIYYATGACTLCGWSYVKQHNEYIVHYSSGSEISRVRCCYYY